MDRKLKVLMLNGSPRENGNIALAFHEMEQVFAENGVEYENILLGRQVIRGCIACETCRKTHRCVFPDLVNELAVKFEAADGLVIGSPVYYGSANGTLMSALQRLFYSTSFDKSMKVGASVVSARRSGIHNSAYDACALMAIRDEHMRAKAAFEVSDFGTRAAVCVVTDHDSDDANGCNTDQDAVWLQIVGAGDVFCVHCSLDGERFGMVRLFRLPAGESVKADLEARSPAGEGGLRFFSDVTPEHRPVRNLRTGI